MFLKILFLNGVLSFGFFGVPKSSFELLGPIHLVLRPRICSSVNPYLYKAKIITPCTTWNPGIPGLWHRCARAFRPSLVDICTLVIRRQTASSTV